MAKQSILEDYIDPPRQDFDPRPNASQAVAAQKRARTMESVFEPPQPISYSHILAVVVTAVLIAAGIAIVSQSTAPRPLVATPAPAVEQPTLAPSVTSPAPTSAPIAQIAVYGSPDGAVLGPIEITRRIEPIAHYGDGWVQAEVEGSGLVWIRLADMPGLTIVGRDLSIAPTPVPQAMQLRPAWSPPAQPTSPPAPTDAPVAVVESHEPLRIRAEDDCNAEHGRCEPPCTAEHGRCAPGDK